MHRGSVKVLPRIQREKRTFNDGILLAMADMHSGAYLWSRTEVTPSVDNDQRDCSKQAILNVNRAWLVSFEVDD